MFYRDKVRVKEELDNEFKSILPSRSRRREVFAYLIHAGHFTRDELCSVASLQIISADRLLARMIASNIIRKGSANVWEITSLGKRWLLEETPGLNHEPVQKKLNGSVNGNSRIAKHFRRI